jgi:hydroxymethylglutaryl-CoA lyase
MTESQMIRIIESPREGMQGVEQFIPTDAKVRFINALLRTCFHAVETGSIVNPRVVPQMADTPEVLAKLDFSRSCSERMLLALNRKGAERAVTIPEMTTLSYPFAFTPTFLQKNVRSTVDDVYATTAHVLNVCAQHGKKAVIYISYAYGNPYGDSWSLELLLEWIGKLKEIGAKVIPLSNVSVEIDAGLIHEVFTAIIREYPEIEFGLHLHHGKGEWIPKVEAAWEAGCRRYDTVIKGFGGCPMSGEGLMGNLDTMKFISWLEQKQIPHGLQVARLHEAITIANEIYRN